MRQEMKRLADIASASLLANINIKRLVIFSLSDVVNAVIFSPLDVLSTAVLKNRNLFCFLSTSLSVSLDQGR